MMTIGSATGAAGGMQAGYSGMNMQADAVSKDLQRQIANAQKKMQELSSNEDMTMEEKMKKRQEIQQEISNLNQQLRQHQMEQRREQRSEGASMDDMMGGNHKTDTSQQDSKKSGLSQGSMQAMISAESSMKQAQVQGGMAVKMEGRAGVLESEIKMDAGRGQDTADKEAELADLKEKSQAATNSQLSALADANQTMKKSAEEERTAGEAPEDAPADKVSTAKEESPAAAETSAEAVSQESQPPAYISVDVRL